MTRSPVKLPPRAHDAHKGDFGRVLLIGGSRGMSGSIAMSAACALKSGAGLVTAAVPNSCLDAVASINPAIMTLPQKENRLGQFHWDSLLDLQQIAARYDTFAMGPGMGQGGGSLRLVRWFTHLQSHRVLDADGLNLLAADSEWTNKSLHGTILTPHPGEWQRLSGISAKDRAQQCHHAKQIAQQCGAVIVLKGGPTYVTDGQHEYWNTTGNPGMASGGSGDCLTGIIAGFLGQGLSCWQAAELAVWVHGRAGDLAAQRYGVVALTAVELMECLPLAIAEAY